MKKQYDFCGFNSNVLDLPQEYIYGIVEKPITDEIQKHFNDTEFVLLGGIEIVNLDKLTFEKKRVNFILDELDIRLQLAGELEDALDSIFE